MREETKEEENDKNSVCGHCCLCRLRREQSREYRTRATRTSRVRRIPELPPCGTWKQYLFGDPSTYHHIETLCREGELISEAGSTVFCGTRNSIESASPAAPYADMCAYLHDPVSALPPTCDPAEVNEMPDERIEAFVKSVDGGSYGVTTRWDVPPVVRIASNVPERQRNPDSGGGRENKRHAAREVPDNCRKRRDA